ncbi:MAG TPA: non-heme iron oxygenase ferredoxin subunit [Gemmatimonadota bacterium]|nr:non-heme iron oxygenase ferredoxin subunit [Gemmatimonadota bacterium]
MGEFRTVASVEDIPATGLKGLEVDGQDIVLVRQGGEIYALEDRCSHEEFRLSDGEMVAGQIECALHGARFDPATGAPKALPAVKPVRTFECRVQDGQVQVRVD